jgi:hypothetical protein
LENCPLAFERPAPPVKPDSNARAGEKTVRKLENNPLLRL